MRRFFFPSLLLLAFVSTASPSPATIVEANGFPSLTDCGEGLVVAEGFHSAVVNLLSPEHVGKTWFLTGRLWKCGGFLPREVAFACSKQSNTSVKLFLHCEQEVTETCKMLEDGVRTDTRAGISQTGPFDDLDSGCVLVPCSSSSSLPPVESQAELPLPGGELRPNNPSDSAMPEEIDRAFFLGERFRYRIANDEVPLYSVVSSFFHYLEVSFSGERRHFTRTLRELGIEPGSVEAGSVTEFFLRKMVDEAIVVLDQPTVAIHLEGKAFMEHQYAELRHKAARLGIVYRTLIEGLQDAGIPRTRLESYCEQKVRPHLSIFSTEEDNSRYLEALRAFDQQLSKL